MNGGQTVNVYLTELDPTAEAAFDALAPDGAVSFIKTPHSLAALQAIQQHLLADTAALAAQGVDIEKLWPEVRTGLETIGVNNLTAADETILQNAFGADNIDVYNVSPDQRLVPLEVTRISDVPPYNASDSITNHGGGCSNAFGVTSNSDHMTYSVTAAHCFPSGVHIFNAICKGNYTTGFCSTLGGSNTEMGTVGARDLSNGGIDSETLHMRGSDLVFNGATGVHTTDPVFDLASNPEGFDVCADGSYDGERCDVRIIDNDVCEHVNGRGSSDVMACNLVYAGSETGVAVVGGGDSGGPVYRYITGTLQASGTITGGAGPTATCPGNATEGRHCYTYMYYTTMYSVLQKWGFTLNTSQ